MGILDGVIRGNDSWERLRDTQSSASRPLELEILLTTAISERNFPPNSTHMEEASFLQHVSGLDRSLASTVYHLLPSNICLCF